MGVQEIPDAILRAHPELRVVGEALEAERDGRPVTARCPTCHKVLRIERPSADLLQVECGNGCTSFRARRSVPG